MIEKKIPLDGNKKLRIEIKALRGKVKTLEKIVTDCSDRYRAYDAQYMLGMESRHKELTGRLEELHEKLVVISEVGYYARNTSGLSDQQRSETVNATLYALDLGQKWWDEGRDLSVAQWAARFLREYQTLRAAYLGDTSPHDNDQQLRANKTVSVSVRSGRLKRQTPYANTWVR